MAVNTTTPTSFYNQNGTEDYTETNVTGPAQTAVADNDADAPTSFYKGTGANVSYPVVTD